MNFEEATQFKDRNNDLIGMSLGVDTINKIFVAPSTDSQYFTKYLQLLLRNDIDLQNLQHKINEYNVYFSISTTDYGADFNYEILNENAVRIIRSLNK